MTDCVQFATNNQNKKVKVKNYLIKIPSEKSEAAFSLSR